MKHCQRDFKRETPQEYESWRELFLRKHDEREERLRMLTVNIRSAHANKPKGKHTGTRCHGDGLPAWLTLDALKVHACIP